MATAIARVVGKQQRADWFAEQMEKMLALWQKTDETVSDRKERGETLGKYDGEECL